jgi:tripartite-type tricarboxylate transporter receptor subunit TctC
LADQSSAAFDQRFGVENRAGGGGLIADEAVARSEPDGYTLMASGLPSHVLAPAMSAKSISFDPVRDFTHIAYLGGPPNVFVVHTSLPVHSFKELLDLMRTESGGVEYVSASLGSVGDLLAQYVAAKEKFKPVHVAYRGGGAAILDLVAGHVKVSPIVTSFCLALGYRDETSVEQLRRGVVRRLYCGSVREKYWIGGAADT